MESSILISLLALFVSLFSFWVSWKAYHRDSSNLRVKLFYQSLPNGESFFNIGVTNFGRRVSFAERFIINFKKSEPLQTSIAGGHSIAESEPFYIQLHIYGMDGIPHHIPPDVTSVEVYDTRDRRYMFPRLSIKDLIEFMKLRAEIRKLWETEQELSKS
jgi:hypothetical protein